MSSSAQLAPVLQLFQVFELTDDNRVITDGDVGSQLVNATNANEAARCYGEYLYNQGSTKKAYRIIVSGTQGELAPSHNFEQDTSDIGQGQYLVTPGSTARNAKVTQIDDRYDGPTNIVMVDRDQMNRQLGSRFANSENRHLLHRWDVEDLVNKGMITCSWS